MTNRLTQDIDGFSRKEKIQFYFLVILIDQMCVGQIKNQFKMIITQKYTEFSKKIILTGYRR